MKTLKFRPHLAEMILRGEKHTTWRLFDDKDLTKGDRIELINWKTGDVFGQAEITEMSEKKFADLTEADWDGHEKFDSEQDMYQTYSGYYGQTVGAGTIVKVLRMKALQ